MLRVSLAALTALALSSGVSAQDDLQVETLADGLDYPWSVAELPDGRYLVTEKSGQLRIVGDEGVASDPVDGGPVALYSGQGGLLDVVLHPRFEETGLVYLTWSEGTPRANTLKLGRGVFDGQSLVGFQEIFAATDRPTDVHYGARLAFLGDGTLLLGIGDGFDYREQAQLPDNHYGAFVHLREDGSPLPSQFDNAAPGVFTIGHRNPQAVAVDPETGTVYAHEHGPQGGDEINVLVEGANYGWPITSYGIDYTGALVTPFETYEGMAEPLLHWTPSIAPAGMAFYSGEMFAEWQGDLLVAALIPGEAAVESGHLRRVDIENGEVVGQDVLLGDLGVRMRDVRQATDGALLILTDAADGQLLRVSR